MSTDVINDALSSPPSGDVNFFRFLIVCRRFCRRVRALARKVMSIVVFLPNFASYFLDAEVVVATAHHFIRKSFHFSSFPIFSRVGNRSFYLYFMPVKYCNFPSLSTTTIVLMSTACVAYYRREDGGSELRRQSCRGS